MQQDWAETFWGAVKFQKGHALSSPATPPPPTTTFCTSLLTNVSCISKWKHETTPRVCYTEAGRLNHYTSLWFVKGKRVMDLSHLFANQTHIFTLYAAVWVTRKLTGNTHTHVKRESHKHSLINLWKHVTECRRYLYCVILYSCFLNNFFNFARLYNLLKLIPPMHFPATDYSVQVLQNIIYLKINMY